MFKLFGKAEDPHRKEVRRQFSEATTALYGASEMDQMAVDHAINMTHSMFLKRFGSIEDFSALPPADKMLYIDQLSSFESGVGDSHMALGTALFKMWVGALVEGDAELIKKFAEGLAPFSRKGEALAGS